MRIVLIGLRATGKTTIGRALAKRLDMPFADSDDAVAQRTGRTPADWLRERGEASFRRVEQEAIADLARSPSGVLAIGGGAPTEAANRAALSRWTAIWLDAPVEVLVERLRRCEAASRPALTDLPLAAEVRTLQQRRCADYQAMAPALTVLTDRPPLEVVDDLLAALDPPARK